MVSVIGSTFMNAITTKMVQLSWGACADRYDLISSVMLHKDTTPETTKSESTHKMKKIIGEYTDTEGHKWSLEEPEQLYFTEDHPYRMIENDTEEYFDFTFNPNRLLQLGFKPIVVVEKLKVGDMFDVLDGGYCGKVVLISDGKATVVLFDYAKSRDVVGVVTVSETDMEFKYCMVYELDDFAFKRIVSKD